MHMNSQASKAQQCRYPSALLLSFLLATSSSLADSESQQTTQSSDVATANGNDSAETVTHEPVYEDDLVTIRFRYQPTSTPRHVEDCFVRRKIKAIVTNKSRTETLLPISFHKFGSGYQMVYASRLGKLKDDCGNDYALEGVSPDSHGHRHLTIPPGKTRQFTVTFFGAPKATAKLLILNSDDGPFANTRDFEVGIPIRAGEATGHVAMSKHPPPSVRHLGYQ